MQGRGSEREATHNEQRQRISQQHLTVREQRAAKTSRGRSVVINDLKTPKRGDPWKIRDLRLAYRFLNIYDEIAFLCFLFFPSFSVSFPFLSPISVFWFSCLGSPWASRHALGPAALGYGGVPSFNLNNIKTNPRKKTPRLTLQHSTFFLSLLPVTLKSPFGVQR